MKKHLNKSVILLVIAMVACLSIVGCFGGKAEESKNSKNIVFLVPAGPGGGNDLTVRALIPGMKQVLGVDIIAENKSAAKGAVAASEIMNGKIDDNKLYFNSQTLLLMPYGGMPDVKLEKFQPVAQVVEDTASIIVRADSPYKSLTEFVAAAKQQKGEMRAAHNGMGGVWHLSAIQFSKAAGIDFRYFAYTTGGWQMLNALMDGEVDVCVMSPSESKPFIENGKIRVLAVMSEKRHSVVPLVPTCQEVGLDTVFSVWRGVFTTVGTDEQRLEELDKALQNAIQTEEFQSFARNNGLQVRFRDHNQFKDFVHKQRELYVKLMAEINMGNKAGNNQ